MGGDYFALCVAIEELARVDSSVAITLEAAVSLGAMPIYRFGTPEQKAQWLPKLLTGEALAAFGLTEPGFGSDAGGAQTRAVLDERTRRMGHQRQQGVHHQLGHRHHRRRGGGRGHRRRPRRPQGALDDPGAVGYTWLPGPAGVLQGRLVRLGHARADLRRRTGAGGQPARRARPGFRPVPAHPRRGPGRDRGAGHRPGPGLRGRVAALRPGAPGVRPADRRVPGDPVQDRRHGGPDPHRAAGLARRGRADAAGLGLQAGRPRSPSCTRARSR